MRVLTILLFFAAASAAHDPISTKLTWTREISRLVYRRCASCHHPAGSAMSLLTYADARPWAVAIAEEVQNRRMPPWGAVKGFGEFSGDMSLTQEEINLFSNWVAGGSPEGDPASLPPPFKAQPSTDAVLRGRQLRVNGPVSLPATIELLGIRPARVAPGASVQLTAQRPDGSVEPLLWLLNFRPEFVHGYHFATPPVLPAGTRISVAPRGAGAFVFYYRQSAGGLRSQR